MPLSPCCHFERTREIFFVRGRAKAVRKADHGKHHMPNNWDSRCFMQTALRRKTKTGNEKDPSAALGMTKRENASSHFFSFRGSQPPPLRGTSFQRKEGTTRMPLSPCCHFERMREIFFVRGETKEVRKADHGKHHMPNNWGSRCFMQTALRRKTKTGDEKDPSAALGMTKRENASSHFFSFRGRQPPPLRAPPSKGRREKQRSGITLFIRCPSPLHLLRTPQKLTIYCPRKGLLDKHAIP